MRPTKLELKGFASFREDTALEFDDADLFVLAGSTGAGKSSLVDALVFALYGSVPRYDDRRRVAPVISQGLNEARVRLTFDAEGHSYTATRIVRRTKTGASTKEARLERLDSDGSATVLAGSADELTTAVESLLGLSFDHFTKTVVLPQGAFQEFMHAKPGDRQDLLVELLDLDVYRRVASAARQRAAEADQAATLLERRLDGELAGATEKALTEAQSRVAALEELAGRIAEAQPRLDALKEEGGRLRQAADTARERAGLVADVTAPEGVAELTDRRSHAIETRDAAKATLEEAVAAREEAEALQERLPSPELLRRVRGLIGRGRELDERLVRARERLSEAETERDAAEERLETARQRTAEQRSLLEHAQRQNLAATLAHGLEAGEPCPVCDRDLETAPEIETPDGLEEARRDLESAADEEEVAATAAREAAASVEGLRADVAGLEEQRGETAEELEEAVARLRATPAVTEEDPATPERLDVLDGRVSEAAEGRKEAGEAERRARQRLRTAEEELAALDDTHEEARRRFEEERDRLAALEPPPVERDDLAGAWETLVTWADERRPELEKAAAEADAAVEETRAQYREVVAELRRACEELEVAVGERTPGEACAAALERARGRVETIDAQLAEAAEAREKMKERTTEARLAKQLGQHLSARNFERWLLNRALRRLVAGATEILRDLTDGAYSLGLDDDNQFEVIDHRNADEARSARTLSGGETFLASLSLALALSEHVADLAADGSARLDALFLDEGFGTLDADTLDTVAAAIEELGARGRMVGIITHVRDLAERIPVRYEVRKTAGGSTVERVHT